jgi:hypothetical protein
MIKKCLITIILLAISITAHAENHQHLEKWYQKRWCAENKGQMEVVMPDRTRCDCVTDTHAIEFDFAKKWREALAQSLDYGMRSNKRPGIVLILENQDDLRYWIRLNSIIEHYKLPITTWMITPESK